MRSYVWRAALTRLESTWNPVLRGGIHASGREDRAEIARIHEYLDSQEALEAVGLSEWVRGHQHSKVSTWIGASCLRCPLRFHLRCCSSDSLWKKNPGRSIMDALDLPESSAGEISAWLLEWTDPAWADEVKEAARRDE